MMVRFGTCNIKSSASRERDGKVANDVIALHYVVHWRRSWLMMMIIIIIITIMRTAGEGTKSYV
jgi:hypothetical protein